MTTLTKAQLNQILSALDNQPRNPNTKDAALKAIGRHGERLGLKLDDILSAAAGLLDGRMSAEAFRASLQEAEQPAEDPIEPAAEAPVEPESAAEVAPAEAANAQPKAPKLRNGTCPQGVRSTKQALMIAMLRRPEGATVEQIAEATAWARHTVRGAMAGALKKKLGLTITSEKTRGRGPYLPHCLSENAAMARTTLQQRLIEALIAKARGTLVESRSRKYVTLKRPDGSFYFVGKAGALRFGNTVTASMAAPDDFKRRILEENAQ